jgi:predicted RNase H-like HicB family nuclease
MYNVNMSKSTKNLTYTVWQEGKHFVAQCLNVDVSSFGKTHEEALLNAREAVSLYLEDANNKVLDIQRPSIVIDSLDYA